MNDQFAADIRKGLHHNPKYLPSKYFYDEVGDRLFQKIMGLSEYYLTDAEFQILYNIKADLPEKGRLMQSFNLVELGAGDGYKTKILLKHLIRSEVDFRYIPIDISENVLNKLQSDLQSTFPELSVEPVTGEYFSALDKIRKHSSGRNFLLFLGSTIGNFSFHEAVDFLKMLHNHMNDGDYILIGFDLKKDPLTILRAYNDYAGVTRDFNMNLLHRINRELGGNFRDENFYHYPMYDPSSGEARSYLISRMAQEVYIEKLNETISFALGEPVLMEISRKYDREGIENLATKAGFTVCEFFFDDRRYFTDVLWQA